MVKNLSAPYFFIERSIALVNSFEFADRKNTRSIVFIVVGLKCKWNLIARQELTDEVVSKMFGCKQNGIIFTIFLNST